MKSVYGDVDLCIKFYVYQECGLSSEAEQAHAISVIKSESFTFSMCGV